MNTNDTPGSAEGRPPGFGVLPVWAVRALLLHKPVPGSFGYEPDAEMLERWENLRTRFVNRWSDLKVNRWKVPRTHPCYADLRRIYPPDEYVRQCILETAIECAMDSTDPIKSAQAKKELDRLNEEIFRTAGALSGLLRQRAELLDSHPVEDWPGWGEVDHIRLWESFREVLKGPAFVSLTTTYSDVTEPFVHLMRKSGRRAPGWCELLDCLTMREPQSVLSDPGIRAAVSSPTKSTEWSRWGRQLLGLLDGWADYPPGFLAGCLTYEQISLLAEVASGAPDTAFSSDQMRKLTKGYRQADDSTG
jgi:hypothetical protein